MATPEENIAVESAALNVESTNTEPDLGSSSFNSVKLLSSTPCANLIQTLPQSPVNCSVSAKEVCSRCYLVAYCSKNCQRAHWEQHRVDCKSDLLKASWQPRWISENRMPTFIKTNGPHTSHGNLTYLCGNVPALDILRLASNEGDDYGRDIALCFAVSGDLRNVVKTINAIPEFYPGRLTVAVNDRNDDVVVRTVILLLLANLPNSEIAADAAIHFWYSALVTAGHVNILRTHIHPQVATVVAKIASKEDGVFLASTISLGSSQARIVLTKYQWTKLLHVITISHETSRTEKARVDIMLHRKDYIDRQLFGMQVSKRSSTMHLRQTGVLLPFGASQQGFQFSNPSLFDANGAWLQRDAASAIQGWDEHEVCEVSKAYSLPKNDLNGGLYFFLKHVITSLYQKLRSRQINFIVTATSAENLRPVLPSGLRFDRIEVSNIMDIGYLGPHPYTLLRAMQSLLNPTNPRATLLTQLLNAIPFMEDHKSRDVLRSDRIMQLAFRYLPITSSSLRPGNPWICRVTAARALLLPFDELFEGYIQMAKFNEIGQGLKMVMKINHTIVEEWPFRLKKKFGEPGAQEEFEALESSGLTGCERYIEWQLA